MPGFGGILFIIGAAYATVFSIIPWLIVMSAAMSSKEPGGFWNILRSCWRTAMAGSVSIALIFILWSWFLRSGSHLPIELGWLLIWEPFGLGLPMLIAAVATAICSRRILLRLKNLDNEKDSS